MPRRGDGIYQRGKGKTKTWCMDVMINGVRYQKRLGKGIKESVALELATIERAKILRGEAGIGKKRKDLPFKEARKQFDEKCVSEKRATTQRGYLQCLERLGRTFDDKRLSEITPWALEKYKSERTTGVQLVERPDGLSDAEWERRRKQALRGAPIRVNRELAVLKTLFNRCR